MIKVFTMKLKKLIVIPLALTVILSAAACGSEPAAPEITEPVSQSQAITATVTVPEGTSCTQIAQLLEEKGVCSADDFLLAANNPDNLSLLPCSLEETENRAFLLEGYIFPDTYEFYLNCSGQAALERFLDNTKLKIKQSYIERAKELGYTMDEIIIIASIIQEEAGNPKNMNDVSSVIHNRLESRDYPYIQCDVAIRYLEDYIKPYFSQDEYSTICQNYNIVSKRKGLPAGAITNPGTAAIEAALWPADTDYFYFVTDSDGNYYFAETYSEHCKNCRTAGIKGY